MGRAGNYWYCGLCVPKVLRRGAERWEQRHGCGVEVGGAGEGDEAFLLEVVVPGSRGVRDGLIGWRELLRRGAEGCSKEERGAESSFACRTD